MFEEINGRPCQFSAWVSMFITIQLSINHCFLGAALDIILIVETKYLIKAA